MLIYSIVGLYLLGVFALVIQRRLLHPFWKYPGPWLNSLSEIPAAIALASGRQQAYYRRLHSQYGTIVRVAPNELSFADPGAWKDIYNRKAPQMEKHSPFAGVVSKTHGSVSVSMAPLLTKDHSRQRRALGCGFSTHALLQQQDIIQLHVRKLIVQMQRLARASEQIDITNWYTFTTFDLVGDLTFGAPFGCLDQQGMTDWVHAIVQVFVSGVWEEAICRVAGIHTWGHMMLKKLLLPREATAWRKLHFTKCIETFKKRIKDGERNHKDLIYFVLKNKEARQNLSETELLLNVMLLIIAGGETTASTLTVWTYFVCTNRKVYKRLVDEIRGKFKSTDDMVWEAVQPEHLPYLHATIQEALRLIPPPAASQQRIVPPGGTTICGEFIPGGYYVAVPPFVTHFDTNFKDPLEFRPERWLSREDPDWDDRFANDVLGASQPFSLGPRVCLGRTVASFEMRLILSNIVWHFDMTLANPQETINLWTTEDDMKHFKGYLTWIRPPLEIRLQEAKRE